MSSANIEVGFKQTGIWPISKTILHRHFQFNSATQASSPDLPLSTGGLPSSKAQKLVKASSTSGGTNIPTGQTCSLPGRESELGCQHPGCKRMLGAPDVSSSPPTTPGIPPATRFDTLLQILVQEPSQEKRTELATALKEYGEDEKTKVGVCGSISFLLK
jgi:hypothetical protein